ncbi:MAG: hypothetical protein AAF726_22570 [Planctomycetota bacterium]
MSARGHGRGRRIAGGLALFAALLCPACINGRAERGLEPVWESVDPSDLVVGTSTRADVLDLLGVPSQVVALDGGSVFYYLQEHMESTGVILLLYNSREERVKYTRAIFFFDVQGRLTHYAITPAE